MLPKIKPHFLSIITSVTLTGCSSYQLLIIDNMNTSDIHSFNKSLGKEYTKLAREEENNYVEAFNSYYYGQKAFQANLGYGEHVLPGDPKQWDTLSQDDKNMLAQARERLLQAYTCNSRMVLPYTSAKAQGAYERWQLSVVQANYEAKESTTQYKPEKHRAEFMELLDKMRSFLCKGPRKQVNVTCKICLP